MTKARITLNINLTEKEQIIRAIRENPGIMARELKTLLPHIEHKVIVKHLRRMNDTVICRDTSGPGYKTRWRLI